MKTITPHTHDIIFKPSFSQEGESKGEEYSVVEKEFVEEYGDLDSFLDECLNPMSAEKMVNRWENDPDFECLRSRCEDVKKLLRKYRKEGPEKSRNSGSVKEVVQENLIKIGTVIGERYEILGLIASGGFGDVYKGRHIKLAKNVALKVLKKGEIKDRQVRERFFREAKLMASIDHPNVVKIYDVGEIHSHIYLVMDFVEGKNFERFLKEKEELSVTQKLELMIQIAEALSAVHQHGIVHRDIKPSNIMITGELKPLLMDFGIAKGDESREIDSKNLTLKGHLVGTPHYMSPEQFKSPSQISKASDVYSLGITFYQMLTGKLPIKGKTYFELYDNHQKVSPIPPHILSKNLSPKISQVVSKMLNKDPAKRYRDGGEVAKGLKGIRPMSLSRKIPMGAGFLLLGFIGFLAITQIRTDSDGKIGPPVAEEKSLQLLTDSNSLAAEWYSQPRIFSVIPFEKEGSKDSYFSDSIVAYLSEMGYDLVEREQIDRVLNELAMNKEESFSKETAVKIGRLVGAHFIITGNISSFQDEKQISLRAFNVETSEILGAVKIDPSMPKKAIEDLFEKIDSRLLFRSAIASLNNTEVTLIHGTLHGAAARMRLRVLGRDDSTIGLLETNQVNRENSTAKLVAAEGKIETGMRVEEVKKDNSR